MSNPPTSSKRGLKFQDLGDLRDLQRSALHSYFRRQVDDLADEKNLPLLTAFQPIHCLRWLGSYLKYAFRSKHPFANYPETGERGLYRLRAAGGGQTFRISIAGDWGTGTKEAATVAQGMKAFMPDYTIHLGDVYYVGDATEVEENCLGKSACGYQGVNWPHGAVGSFAMNGNHEMYANGDAYFDVLMPTLGIPSSQDGRQLASFFCLENDIWRILALDTAYNSIGIPVLEKVPLVNRIPGVGPSCKLEDVSIDWLGTVVRPKERPRATILLTHHQYFSAFDKHYHLPAEQLMESLGGQDLLWIWGHEHRWAIYAKHCAGSLTAYGRCIGHGGMPIEISHPKKHSDAPLQYYDQRIYSTSDKHKVGMNGFLNMEIAGNTLTLDHRDVTDTTVLRERFTAAKEGIASHQFLQVHAGISEGPAAPAALAHAKHV